MFFLPLLNNDHKNSVQPTNSSCPCKIIWTLLTVLRNKRQSKRSLVFVLTPESKFSQSHFHWPLECWIETFCYGGSLSKSSSMSTVEKGLLYVLSPETNSYTDSVLRDVRSVLLQSLAESLFSSHIHLFPYLL